MYSKLFLFLLLFWGVSLFSQNDIDAIRYSRRGVNGTSRFVAMGGAFGAIGADLSCSAYNPAGLALYRKGEISYSGGIRTNNNTAMLNNSSSNSLSSKFVFNNFGFAIAWPSKNDRESRNVFSYSSTQILNYFNKVQINNNTNQNSIAKDMLNLANEDKTPKNTYSGYEGLAYQTYLLDYDPSTSKFFSLLDINRTVKQTRELITDGKLKELNFSYAYSYKDNYYFGVSIGIPRVDYTSNITHVERDEKDSMQLGFPSASTFTSTFINPPLTLDPTYKMLHGFKSLTYTEYFKTTGTGINLKIGGIARAGENLRLGAYYHTATVFNLTDVYYNQLSVNWDKDTTTTLKDPEQGGTFSYAITTPARFSINAAYVLKKIAVIGVDYEFVNYSKAALSSTVNGVFDGVNAVIRDKYKLGQNFRIGAEINIKPVIIRLGYNMQASPFGNAYGGSFVRHTPSLGIGIRSKSNLYLDAVWCSVITNENYFLFITLLSKAAINYKNSMLAVTLGIKF